MSSLYKLNVVFAQNQFAANLKLHFDFFFTKILTFPPLVLCNYERFLNHFFGRQPITKYAKASLYEYSKVYIIVIFCSALVCRDNESLDLYNLEMGECIKSLKHESKLLCAGKNIIYFLCGSTPYQINPDLFISLKLSIFNLYVYLFIITTSIYLSMLLSNYLSIRD